MEPLSPEPFVDTLSIRQTKSFNPARRGCLFVFEQRQYLMESFFENYNHFSVKWPTGNMKSFLEIINIFYINFSFFSSLLFFKELTSWIILSVKHFFKKEKLMN